jgi:hypothetical protein
MSVRRSGASAPSPPIWMPMLDTLANPHTANTAIALERGSMSATTFCSSPNAISSLMTARVPSTLPTSGQSDHGTPIVHAIGANSQPSMRCSVSGSPPISTSPSPLLTSATRAMNTISMAPTLTASLSPSVVPLAAASSRFELASRGSTILSWPDVTGSCSSGTISFEVTTQIGAVMATAASSRRISTPPIAT